MEKKKKDTEFFWYVACKVNGYEPIMYPMKQSNLPVVDDMIKDYLKKNVCFEHRNLDFVDSIDELVYVAIDINKKAIVITLIDPYEFWPLEDLEDDLPFYKEFLEDILGFSFVSIFGDEEGGEKKSNGKD